MKNSLIIKYFILLLTFLFFFDATAQSSQRIEESKTRKKNIFIGLFSSNNLMSINYDMRFSKKKENGLGFGLGFGYTPYVKNFTLAKYISVPVEINYLIGKRKHFGKIGLGYLYNYSWTDLLFTTNSDEPFFWESKEHYVYVPVAYRFQAIEKGLFLELVVNSAVSKDLTGINMEIFPGLNIGYSF